MVQRRLAVANLLGACAGASLWTNVSAAQTFPSRPVRIFTPFPAGSGPDAALRTVADRLSREWKQAVVVDNKPGGNGFIAVSAFKQSSNDGHNLIQLDNSHITTHPHTFSKLPYNAQQDFTPFGMMLRTYFFIAVAGDSSFKTLDQLVAAAKASPNKLTYGSWSNGSPDHLGALRLLASTGTQMTHVVYRDFGQLYAAVANKDVDWALASIGSAGALEKAGKLRFIARAASTRHPEYPNAPATGEMSAWRDFDVSGWIVLAGPAAMPVAQRDQLAADLAGALATPEVADRYKALGYEAPSYQPVALADYINSQRELWGGVVKGANLRLD